MTAPTTPTTALVVIVDQVHLTAGTVCTATGVEEVTGDRITFGLDCRLAYGLIEQCEREGSVRCSVEPWQVLT